MTMRGKSAEDIIASLERDDFHLIDEAPRTPGLRAGARVHNRCEQYHAAYTHGTATVLAVLRRGTDEKPDSWERQWGRPNVEVVVQRDRDEPPTCWADYGTGLALEQPAARAVGGEEQQPAPVSSPMTHKPEQEQR